MQFAASREQVWDGLLFYEQVAERPPLHLRLLLPLPIRAEGTQSKVGDEARCIYERGYLVKRMTRVDPGYHLAFDVVAQHLALGGGMRLLGGNYTLQSLPHGRTQVAATTRYVSPRRPRWLWHPIQATICHMFHRFLLGAIGRTIVQHG
jgi:hypothetical protein